jgi:hypothetical protein
MQFEKWWSKEIISGIQDELTRKRLVFALRHQDGGSHVGTLTDQSYVRLKSGANLPTNSPGQPPIPMVELATATMRQVAWEVTETMNELGEIK